MTNPNESVPLAFISEEQLWGKIAWYQEEIALDRASAMVTLMTAIDAIGLLLTDHMLSEESIVDYDPFIMINSRQPITQAIKDFNSG